MSSYQIIDEPKPSAYDSLIADPTVILFAALLVPLFVDLPFYGRVWLPLLWAVANGFLLGSPTKIKESVIAIGGALLLAALIVSLAYLANTNVELMRSVAPYFRITIQGVLFFTLYLIVFYQSVPYSIHQYVKEQNKN